MKGQQFFSTECDVPHCVVRRVKRCTHSGKKSVQKKGIKRISINRLLIRASDGFREKVYKSGSLCSVSNNVYQTARVKRDCDWGKKRSLMIFLCFAWASWFVNSLHETSQEPIMNSAVFISHSGDLYSAAEQLLNQDLVEEEHFMLKGYSRGTWCLVDVQSVQSTGGQQRCAQRAVMIVSTSNQSTWIGTWTLSQLSPRVDDHLCGVCWRWEKVGRWCQESDPVEWPFTKRRSRCPEGSESSPETLSFWISHVELQLSCVLRPWWLAVQTRTVWPQVSYSNNGLNKTVAGICKVQREPSCLALQHFLFCSHSYGGRWAVESQNKHLTLMAKRFCHRFALCSNTYTRQTKMIINM